MKVIFHIDEMDKWNLCLNNAGNFLKEVPDAEIIILSNSEAIRGLGLLSPYRERLLGLSQSVSFQACRNSLNALGLIEDDLIKFVTIVPSGVVQLASKQGEGFSYIKP